MKARFIKFVWLDRGCGALATGNRLLVTFQAFGVFNYLDQAPSGLTSFFFENCGSRVTKVD
jgi:hypothetical protein